MQYLVKTSILNFYSLIIYYLLILTIYDFSYPFRTILSTSTNDENIHHQYSSCNFKKPINVVEKKKEAELSKEPFSMVKSDEMEIKSSQEETKLVNLGIDDKVKEMKIRAKLAKGKIGRLITLLKKFIDMFVWLD